MPGTDDLHSSDIDTISPRLCDALLKLRQLRGHTLDEAAAALGITPRELRAIEAGSAHPEPEMIESMAELYRVDPARLGTDVMVDRSDPAIDPETCVVWLGWLPIEYGSNLATNREILESVADGIRLLRSAHPTASVQMRTEELDLVMTLLDLADENLIADAVRAFRLPWKRTAEIINESRDRVRTKSLVLRARRLVELQGHDGEAAVPGR